MAKVDNCICFGQTSQYLLKEVGQINSAKFDNILRLRLILFLVYICLIISGVSFQTGCGWDKVSATDPGLFCTFVLCAQLRKLGVRELPTLLKSITPLHLAQGGVGVADLVQKSCCTLFALNISCNLLYMLVHTGIADG